MRRRNVVILLISGAASVLITSFADGCVARDSHGGFPNVGFIVELNGLLGIPTLGTTFQLNSQGMPPGSRGYLHAQACAAKARPLVRPGATWVWADNARLPANGWPFQTTRWQSRVWVENRDGPQIELHITEDGGPARIEWGWWANLAVYFVLTTAFTFGFHMLMVMPVRTRRREPSGFPVVPDNNDTPSNRS